jgi:hypothetical protein
METFFNLVKSFILNPKEAWERVKDKEDDSTSFIVSYIVPLALIPAVCSFVGYGLIGVNAGLFGRSVSIGFGLNSALTSFVGTIAGVYLSAWVVQMLAPTFNCKISMNKAVALIGYSYTPMLVAGIFNIIPVLSILSLAGSLYSLYVLYVGFVPMTGVTEEKKTNYFIVTLLVMIGIYIVLSLLLAAIFTSFGLTLNVFN